MMILRAIEVLLLEELIDIYPTQFTVKKNTENTITMDY